MFRSITNSLYNFYRTSPIYPQQDLTKYAILYKNGDDLLVIEEAEYEKIVTLIKNQKSRILTKFFKLCLVKKKQQNLIKQKKIIKKKKLKKKLTRKKKKLKRY